MSPGIIVLVCAVAVGVGLSVFKSRFDGRFRGTHPVRKAAVREQGGVEAEADDKVRLTAAEIGVELGDRATLLQFSSADRKSVV